MARPSERAIPALAWLISLAALGFAIAVAAVSSAAPDKGFLAFTGRQIVDVRPGGPADRAGVRPGDVVVAIDGRPARSTVDYVKGLLLRQPGEVVELELQRADRDAPVRTALVLERAPVPWAAIGAAVLAALLLALGLLARYSRPGDVAAARFWRVTLVFAVVFAGALSWTHLLVQPVLLAIFLSTLCMSAPVGADFSAVFPVPIEGRRRQRQLRLLYYTPPALLLVGLAVAAGWLVRDARAGIPGDDALRLAVRCVAGILVVIAATAALSLYGQVRRARRAPGPERSQLKWLLLGFALSALPTFAAVPVAAGDLERFLLVGYRPFAVAVTILWAAAIGLAVLRVGLADVDAVIHRSAVYGLASAAAVGVYLGGALALGLLAERLVAGGTVIPHVVAAVAAAAAFGPLRERVTRWLDRRFFRDRLHYVAALRELSAAAARVREPDELAREVVDGIVGAVRASSGALYLQGAGDAPLFRLHARDGDYPARAAAPPVTEGGVALPIRDAGVLVLGPRLGGDLYSSQDRDLLAALCEQLAIAFDNARAFGTIAELSRTLEHQNREIGELRDKLEDENRYLRARLQPAGDERIVGGSRVIRQLVSHLEKVAAGDAAVLITGESGTGKGLVARTVHASSPRRDGPFIQVDCGAIPAGVFESELFGHERGAFTGAIRRRRGHFELADGGTLFLDEIGELPLELQPKLLRALQEKSFVRVGGAAAVEVDVRIVAATNRSLEDMVAAGTFRQDLYYRLRVIELVAPPLRSRRSDIPALVEHLLPRLCRRNQRPLVQVSESAMARLQEYRWPGNVRELENVLERAVVLCEGRQLEAGDLALDEGPPSIEDILSGLELPPDASHEQLMDAIEKRRLESALRAAGGNQSRAARALGMARTTFINKMRRYGLL